MSPANITQDEVLRIARLARLSPSPAQAVALATDLNRILGYVAQLSEVDTATADASASVAQATVLREDELAPSLSRDAALAAAPRAHDGGFAVPRVLEGDS